MKQVLDGVVSGIRMMGEWRAGMILEMGRNEKCCTEVFQHREESHQCSSAVFQHCEKSTVLHSGVSAS
jgi:hypothetical protein